MMQQKQEILSPEAKFNDSKKFESSRASSLPSKTQAKELKNRLQTKATKMPKAPRANPYLTDIEKFMNSMGVKKK